MRLANLLVTWQGETANERTAQTVDRNGADIYLDEAHLTIGPGSFQKPTTVTMQRLAAIPHSGAWGPVFQLSVPAPGLVREDLTLALQVQDIGANQPNLTLGFLVPSLPLDQQQWQVVSGGSLSADETSVSGPVTGFGNSSVLQYAAVIGCPPTTTCPPTQACNSGACQQCPTGSSCSP